MPARKETGIAPEDEKVVCLGMLAMGSPRLVAHCAWKTPGCYFDFIGYANLGRRDGWLWNLFGTGCESIEYVQPMALWCDSPVILTDRLLKDTMLVV